jgi:hypothetical protein
MRERNACLIDRIVKGGGGVGKGEEREECRPLMTCQTDTVICLCSVSIPLKAEYNYSFPIIMVQILRIKKKHNDRIDLRQRSDATDLTYCVN